MVDDRSKRGKQDRSRIASKQPYEVSYFQRKHGVTREEAERILKSTRGDRAKADAEAEKLKTIAITAHPL